MPNPISDGVDEHVTNEEDEHLKRPVSRRTLKRRKHRNDDFG